MRLVDAARGRALRAIRRLRVEATARTVVDPLFPAKPMRRYETALGTYFLPADAHADWVAGAMRRGEVFEPEVVEVVRSHARPGTTVLDVGSNFGQMAILFSGMVGATGRVLAFEADDYVHAVLRRNLDAAAAGNVRTFLAAVHERSGEEVIYPEPDFVRFGSYGSYGIDPRATAGRRVKTIAIDDAPIDGAVSFMKVDVQGCDLFAMRGAVETIRRHRMPILFEYEERFQDEFGTCFQDYVDFVASIGYRFARTYYGINFLIVPAG